MEATIQLPVEALGLEPYEGMALPVCLPPWRENPYRLVSLWDMLTFDAGALVRAMQFLAEMYRILERSEYKNEAFIRVSEGEFFLREIKGVIEYSDRMRFRMTKITLDRVTNLAENPACPAGAVAAVVGEASRRLRDEAGIHKLLKIADDKVEYYEQSAPLLDARTAAAFPSVAFDMAEAGKCLATNRPTACVFHLMRVIEIGLGVLAKEFGVSAAHTNWGNIIEGIEKGIRNLPNDRTRPADWKERQEFFSQAASYFMITKDAWRNYTAHARGKYTEEEAETMFINVRGFMQKLATRLHE